MPEDDVTPPHGHSPTFQDLVNEAAKVAAKQESPAALLIQVTDLKPHLDRPQSRVARQCVAEIIRHLAGLLEKTEDPTAIGNLLALVGGVLSGQSVTTAPQPKRARADLQYFRREGKDGPELVEARPGSSKPFHIGVEDFDAALAALVEVGMGRHASFKQVHDAFVRHGGADTVSSYQLRTVLRFLKQAKPDLINGIRDGYKVLFDDAEKFKTKARSAMAALEPRQ
ncbi:hypothetical protein OT109_09360 [Phycisphaeraceae bacterium D3-23]